MIIHDLNIPECTSRDRANFIEIDLPLAGRFHRSILHLEASRAFSFQCQESAEVVRSETFLRIPVPQVLLGLVSPHDTLTFSRFKWPQRRAQVPCRMPPPEFDCIQWGQMQNCCCKVLPIWIARNDCIGIQ